MQRLALMPELYAHASTMMVMDPKLCKIVIVRVWHEDTGDK